MNINIHSVCICVCVCMGVYGAEFYLVALVVASSPSKVIFILSGCNSQQEISASFVFVVETRTICGG